MTNLKVSIVIPVYNEEKMLPLCLDSLQSLDYPKEMLEIIFVDNNSTDKSAKIIKKYPVTYLFEGKKGAGAARNTGIRQAKGEIIAFTDADCVVRKDWINRITEGFKNKNTGCCSGKTVSYKPERFIEKLFEWLFEKQPKWNINYFEDYFIGPVFATCNLACSKKALDEIGLFDDGLLASEDVDLVWRINLKGYQVDYIENAIVEHKRRDKLKELPDVFFKYMYWQYYLIKKYESVIGISIDWQKVMLKTLKGFLYSLIWFFTLNIKKALLYLTIAVLSLMQLFAAVYLLLQRASGKALRMRPLGFVPSKIIWRRNNSEVMIINLESKFGYTLSGAGAKIWELLQDKKTEDYIINDLKTEYQIEETQARQDMSDLVSDFLNEGLIVGNL
jgi:glycosyltransferase involved in cell wall biosynthesis